MPTRHMRIPYLRPRSKNLSQTGSMSTEVPPKLTLLNRHGVTLSIRFQFPPEASFIKLGLFSTGVFPMESKYAYAPL